MDRHILYKQLHHDSWEIREAKSNAVVGVFRKDRDGFFAEHKPNRTTAWGREPFQVLKLVLRSEDCVIDDGTGHRPITEHTIRELLKL